MNPLFFYFFFSAIKETCEWFLANYETCRKWRDALEVLLENLKFTVVFIIKKENKEILYFGQNM